MPPRDFIPHYIYRRESHVFDNKSEKFSLFLQIFMADENAFIYAFTMHERLRDSA